MRKIFIQCAKFFAIASLCSFPFINLTQSANQLTFSQNMKTENNWSSNNVTIAYDGGQTVCTSPSYAIKVNCNFKNTSSIKIEPIIYKNESFAYRQIITMVFSLLDYSEVYDVSYDYITNILVFRSPTYFYQECEIIDNPQNLPGMPQLPKRHNHRNLIGAKLKSSAIDSTYKAKSFLRDAQIKLQLDDDISKWGINTTELKFDNLLMISKNKTIRGFQSNYFGLDANNEYLKALILKSTNLLWIDIAKSSNKYNDIKETRGFQKILEFMSLGKLIDFENEYIKKVIDQEILNNSIYNVHYWIDQLLNIKTDFTLDVIQPTKYSKWIKIYQLDSLGIQRHRLLESLFNGQLSFTMKWTTSENDEIKLTQFNLQYLANLKAFNLTLANDQPMLIDVQDYLNKITIIICDIRFVSSDTLICENQVIPILDINNQLALLDNQKYYSNPLFDITKMISLLEFESVFQWINILNLNKYVDVTEDGIPIIIEQPEKLVKNSDLLKSALQFKSKNSAVCINDKKLKNYLLLSSDTLFDNKCLDNLMTKWTITSYNSKNQILLNFWFKDIDIDGKISSQRSITKNIELNLTPYITQESSDTRVSNSMIKINDKQDTSSITKLILDEYIHYNDQTSVNDYILWTGLNKRDWIDNVFVDLVIINKTEKIWSCNLKFRNNIYKNALEIQNESSINFNLEFDGFNSESTTTPNIENEKTNEIDNKAWIMWGSIVGAIILIVMLITIYFYTKKNKIKQLS